MIDVDKLIIEGGMHEKFTIKITKSGIEITAIENDEQKQIHLKAGEALMLLDILKNEEDNLRNMALKNSPLPFEINLV